MWLEQITSELWEAQNDAYETGDVAPLVDELASANPPWSVLSDKFSILQDELEHQILALSEDEQVFLADTPPQSWVFDFRGHVGSASKALELDLNLAKMRHNLVPQRVTEEDFWKRYFWAVKLIKEGLLVDYTSSNEKFRSVEKLAKNSSEELKLAQLELDLQAELAGFNDNDFNDYSMSPMRMSPQKSLSEEMDAELSDMLEATMEATIEAAKGEGQGDSAPATPTNAALSEEVVETMSPMIETTGHDEEIEPDSLIEGSEEEFVLDDDLLDDLVIDEDLLIDTPTDGAELDDDDIENALADFDMALEDMHL